MDEFQRDAAVWRPLVDDVRPEGVEMTPESPGWDPPIITLPVVGSSYVFRCVFDRFQVL